MLFTLALTTLFPSLVVVRASVLGARSAGADAACLALGALQHDQVFAENTATYLNETTRIWSQSCLAEPDCAFVPTSAQHLADGLKLLVAAQIPFTVRSGGHMPVPGAQSRNDTVFISLSGLNGRELSADKKVARVGPGQTWSDVYNWIAPQGLAVNGGRYGSVGVGGVLLGGGIGYFGSRTGWAADGVVGYQVVLADSSIVYANKTVNPNLFWALKGGSNNFGIVTRFDLLTFPQGPAWAGAAIWSNQALDTFFKAITAYLAPGGGASDPDAAISMIIASTPADSVTEAIFIGMYPGNVSSPKPFENFTSITAPSLIKDLGQRDSWAYLPNALAIPQFSGRGLRQQFYSLAFLPDPRAIAIANQTIITEGLTALKKVANCSLTLTYQPISQAWLQASRAQGGNPIDLDPARGTFVSALISTSWVSAADDAAVLEFSRQAAAKVNAQTRALGLYYPFIYLNDAATGQDPYPLYGQGGANLQRLKSIQRQYDPLGILNKLFAKPFPLK